LINPGAKAPGFFNDRLALQPVITSLLLITRLDVNILTVPFFPLTICCIYY
jgi:hypothetical protein